MSQRQQREATSGGLMALSLALLVLAGESSQQVASTEPQNQNQSQNDFQLYTPSYPSSSSSNNNSTPASTAGSKPQDRQSCSNGLLTFELSTGFIYKPPAPETLAMMPGTLQLTDCLEFCLQNNSCLAINFEMGLCVLLSSSAKQNLNNLYSSQFPVFTIYAEKKCLLAGENQAGKQRRSCQRAWTFERVAGYEMKTKPRKLLKLATKELCMEACLLEREFECRSANWYRQSLECSLSDQDRHSVSQSEAGDQQVKSSLQSLYGPSKLEQQQALQLQPVRSTLPPSLYQNYYLSMEAMMDSLAGNNKSASRENELSGEDHFQKLKGDKANFRRFRQLFSGLRSRLNNNSAGRESSEQSDSAASWAQQYAASSDNLLPANALVDYLENNCVYEPNKLCEFRKIQNRVLKTVDSIYQEVGSLEECKQKCLNAPYRCYSFDYGDTSERVCRTSHLDQASLLSVREPYLDVMGAITYELASCFNVSVQCRAREMVAQVSSSKMFRGKIYVKSRPSSCQNDVRESLKFELSMRYNDDACDVKSSASSQQGVFSNDIVIQHHDRILTTQDVGLSVFCQYDLGNRSITNNVELAIEKLDALEAIESKTKPLGSAGSAPGNQSGANQQASLNSPLTITSLATTVVKSPNVTMRITNMNGQPVSSATVGDRLALLFEIKEKTSPFGIFVREIIAMDGKQMAQAAGKSRLPATNNANNNKPYHYGNLSAGALEQPASPSEQLESLYQANKANSIQFIDADGCPTDANIMGPLVKMDPAGQRILAPFDAFKFPTSDMVFFRAVVSSCVSECKPVVCPPAGLPSSPADAPASTSLLNTDTTALAEFLLPTSSSPSEEPGGGATKAPFGSSTAAPASQPANPSSPYGHLLTSLANSSLDPEGLLVELLRDKARQTTPIPSSSTRAGGDLLTTVPGYQQQQTATQLTTSTQLPEGPFAAELGNQMAAALGANMTTNNHQAGKTPPRPAGAQLQQPAAPADLLSQQQRQHLVGLFEGLLRQQLEQGSQSNLSTANERRRVQEEGSQWFNPQQVSQASESAQQQRAADLLEALLSHLLSRPGANKIAELPPRPRDQQHSAQLARLAGQLGELNSIEPADSKHRSAEFALSKPTRANSQPQAASSEQRKRMKQQQQAFADSYLGAFHSFGRRRKRAAEPHAKELLTTSGPTSFRQAQFNAGELNFTHALVQMYHTSLVPLGAATRRKRQAALPVYELDEEMVVQSIKILDRQPEVALRREAPQEIGVASGGRRAGFPRLDLVTAEHSQRPESLRDQEEEALATGGESQRLISWSSSSGALSMIALALSFILLQVLLVSVFLADLRRRRRLFRERLAVKTSGSSFLMPRVLAGRECDYPQSLASELHSDPLGRHNQRSPSRTHKGRPEVAPSDHNPSPSGQSFGPFPGEARGRAYGR